MSVSQSKKQAVLSTVPLIAAAALLFGAAAELLPIDSVFKITMARLFIAAGLGSIVLLHGFKTKIFRTGLEIPIALLLIAAILATLHADRGAPLLRFLFESVALFYLVVALCRSDRQAVRALTLVALAGVAVSASEGVSQVAQGELTGFYREGFTPVVELGSPPPGSITRAIGSFANPNLLSTHILLLAPVAALSLAIAESRQLRVVIGVLLGLAYLGLVLTFSRAGIGAALLGGAIALYIVKPQLRRHLLIASAGAVAVLILGVILTGGKLVSGFGRPLAYETAIDVVNHNKTFGVGLGRAADVMNNFTPKSSFRHAHNLWLTWWVEAGPLALLAWLWISIVLLWRSLHGALARNPYSLAALVALVGFFAFSLLDHPANVTRIATTFWIVAALAVGAPALMRPEHVKIATREMP